MKKLENKKVCPFCNNGNLKPSCDDDESLDGSWNLWQCQDCHKKFTSKETKIWCDCGKESIFHEDAANLCSQNGGILDYVPGFPTVIHFCSQDCEKRVIKLLLDNQRNVFYE